MESRSSSIELAEEPIETTAPAGSLVIRLRDKIVNSYLIGEEGSTAWIIVDAGMSPGHARKIFKAGEEWFGAGSKPAAIILTHGHFDHVGALHQLLRHWNVPVYAHRAEMPFVTGQAEYPPADPTVGGGLMARISPLFPRKRLDLGDRVQELPGDHSIPHLSSWRWIHTPGHSPGHISLFRESDQTLIAGDAFVTVKNESILAVLLQKKHVCRPPAYLTTDWEQARQSVQRLAELRPELALTGHGQPMRGDVLRQELDELAANFDQHMPRDGRYVRHPAMMDEHGAQYIPPAVPDPMPKVVGAMAAVAATAFVIRRMRQNRQRRRLLMAGNRG